MTAIRVGPYWHRDCYPTAGIHCAYLHCRRRLSLDREASNWLLGRNSTCSILYYISERIPNGVIDGLQSATFSSNMNHERSSMTH